MRTYGLRSGSALLLAGVALGAMSPAFAQDTAAAVEAGAQDEIVVTAQKRSERLQDVPIAVSAFSNEELLRREITGNEDLARITPSLLVTQLSPGESQITIRGINSGYQLAPSVSFYLDETPFDVRTNGFAGAPDIDMFDIARVEVLRGPQGTLYGSSSVGGTVRYISNAPSTDAFTGKLQLSALDTKGGDGLGYTGKVVFNVPLTDNLAVRLFGARQHFSGYTDRIEPVNGYFAPSATDPVGDKDSNTASLTTLRAVARWTPGDWTITPSIHFQHNTADGYAYSDSNRGKYQYAADYTSPNKNRLIVGNLTVVKPLGFADLTSSTSLLDKESRNRQDYSGLAARLARHPIFNPTPALMHTENIMPVDYRSFVQEVRLSSSNDGPFKWVVGGYYSRTKSNEEQYVVSQDLGNFIAGMFGGPVTDNIIFDIIPSKDTQYALFADGTYALTDFLEVSAGVRYYDYTQTFAYTEGGVLSSGVVKPEVKDGKDGFNPRFNVNLKPTENVSIYATASKGFRVGGANPALILTPGQPCAAASVFEQGYGPDTVWNYEVGTKSQMFDRRMTLNVAAYRIDWDNIQTGVPSTCGSFTGNVGSARIKGLEGELTIHVSDELTLGASGSYTHAEYTSINSGYVGIVSIVPGSRLINIPKYQGNLSAEYRTALGGDTTGFARTDVQLIGSMPTSPVSNDPIYKRDNITNVNLVAGVTFEPFEVQLFVRNLFDTFQVQRIGAAQSRNFAVYTVSPPRQVGLTLRYNFQ